MYTHPFPVSITWTYTAISFSKAFLKLEVNSPHAVSTVLRLHRCRVLGVSLFAQLCFSALPTDGHMNVFMCCSGSRDIAGLTFEPKPTQLVQLGPLTLPVLPPVALLLVKCPVLINREEKALFCAFNRPLISGNHGN